MPAPSSLRVALALPLCLAACAGDDPGPIVDEDDLFAVARSNEPHDQDPQLDAEEPEALSADNHALALDLYHELREGQAAGQGFSISPYSIQTAFGMLYGGTVEPARSEMAATLHFSLEGERLHEAHNWLDAQLAARNLPEEQGKDSVIVQTANGVWVLDTLEDQIEAPYLDILSIHYDAGLFLADFFNNPEGERVRINNWVSEQTRELIPELFPQGIITSDTRLVLVNALYLKAPWADTFNPELTTPQTFTRGDGSSVAVPMMHHGQLPASYGEGADYQAIAIPLRGSALELVVILPDDLPAFEASMNIDSLDALLSGLSPRVVDTTLPRFELEAELELSNELKALGMPSPFEDTNSFDAILEELGVITAVVHQTVIEVDEKGIEAAAATGIVIDKTAAPEPDATIVVDRPFVLAIRDQPTDTLLFLGRVLDPSEE
ncbi:MAG: serpin family protein [Deltaproteobacteria bacterium]|nr:serpin family protein [Deltaproteobacteria bacterium]